MYPWQRSNRTSRSVSVLLRLLRLLHLYNTQAVHILLLCNPSACHVRCHSATNTNTCACMPGLCASEAWSETDFVRSLCRAGMSSCATYGHRCVFTTEGRLGRQPSCERLETRPLSVTRALSCCSFLPLFLWPLSLSIYLSLSTCLYVSLSSSLSPCLCLSHPSLSL